jgi:hypothetical protein
MNHYFSKNIKNAPVRRRRTRAHSWSLYLTITLGCFIAYGFISAAQNHFLAMKIGYECQELEKQRAKLELCQRKLTLEMERRLAPQRLDERAQQHGLMLPSARHTVAMQAAAKVAD